MVDVLRKFREGGNRTKEWEMDWEKKWKMDDRTTQNRNYKISNWTRLPRSAGELLWIRAINSAVAYRVRWVTKSFARTTCRSVQDTTRPALDPAINPFLSTIRHEHDANAVRLGFLIGVLDSIDSEEAQESLISLVDDQRPTVRGYSI